jgi:DNA-binding transcriptional LysR family regulator
MPRAVPQHEEARTPTRDPHDRLSDLRFGDLATFLAVRRSGSVTGAARELHVTPSQVSKAVTRIERALRVRLFLRGSRGVELSDAGRRALPQVESLVQRLHQLGRDDGATSTELTVAAPSYLITAFLAPIARSQSDLRVRGIELAPPLLRSLAAQNLFDLAILPGALQRLPATWSCVRVGDIQLGLFAPPAVARKLGREPVGVDKVKDWPFVGPLSNATGQYTPGDDDCPLPVRDRRIGHQVQTIGVALELAARTEHLVFGPVISARAHLESGALVEVRVRGWNVSEPLFVACNSDRVLARVQKAVLRAVRGALDAIG